MFFSEDIFDFILKIARESNLDIVGFRGIKMRNIRANINGMRDLYYYQYPDNLITINSIKYSSTSIKHLVYYFKWKISLS